MLWFFLTAMALMALLFVAVPLRKFDGRLATTALPAALLITTVSAGLYWQIGSPDAQSTAASGPSIDEMVASLDQRLRENPNDLAGWKMLGRSYIELRDYPKAIQAFPSRR